MMRREQNLVTCWDVDLRLGSDHNIVCFNIDQQKRKLQKIKVTSRKLASVDLETFQADLAQSFASTEQCNNVDDLIAYDAVRLTLDKHALVRVLREVHEPGIPCGGVIRMAACIQMEL